MTKVEIFSQGKSKDKNEDYFGYNKTSFIVADGVTDKSGKKYNGRTGGEIISRIVVHDTLATSLNGKELVKYLNNRIRSEYKKLGILKLTENPEYRFGCGFICLRIFNKKIKITYLGDLGFRINGKKRYQEIKKIDILNSDARSKFIKKTGNIEKGREYIIPLLKKQFEFQNNSNHLLGYGIIDGTETPLKFIKTFEYDITNIKMVEIYSDGYFGIPKGSTIESWENMHKKIERQDPHKYLKYKSTKSKDDRTIMIIHFD